MGVIRLVSFRGSPGVCVLPVFLPLSGPLMLRLGAVCGLIWGSGGDRTFHSDADDFR